MKQIELYRAASVAVHDCAQVQPGEHVLVIIDTLHPVEIGEALCAAVETSGAHSALIVLPRRGAFRGERRDGWEPRIFEPMPSVANAMQDADVIFTLVNPYLHGTHAQEQALAAGARVLAFMYYDRFKDPTEMQGDEVVNDFVRMMSVDIRAMNELTERLAAAMQEARNVHLFSAGGTDLYVQQSDNLVTVLTSVIRDMGPTFRGANGRWAHSPAGVTAVAPGNANGVVVCDVSMVPIGHVHEPIRFTIEDRTITKIEGGGQADQLHRYLASFDDPSVYNCPAEWGIGTNPQAVLSGKFLEEESLYGVPHVALGDDTRFHNGTIFAPFHSDIMFRDASVELDGQLILDQGEFLI